MKYAPPIPDAMDSLTHFVCTGDERGPPQIPRVMHSYPASRAHTYPQPTMPRVRKP